MRIIMSSPATLRLYSALRVIDRTSSSLRVYTIRCSWNSCAHKHVIGRIHFTIIVERDCIQGIELRLNYRCMPIDGDFIQNIWMLPSQVRLRTSLIHPYGTTFACMNPISKVIHSVFRRCLPHFAFLAKTTRWPLPYI